MRIALLIACLWPVVLLGQIDWKTLQKHSNAALVYRANAKDVERYIQQDSIDINAYLSNQPIKVFPYNQVNEDSLPGGQYVVVKVTGEKIVAYVTTITD